MRIGSLPWVPQPQAPRTRVLVFIAVQQMLIDEPGQGQLTRGRHLKTIKKHPGHAGVLARSISPSRIRTSHFGFRHRKGRKNQKLMCDVSTELWRFHQPVTFILVGGV